MTTCFLGSQQRRKGKLFKILSILLILLLVSNFKIANADIAVDVGHTYAKPGAISILGIPEIFYNKEVAEKIKEKLECSGVCVFLIEDKQLHKRPEIANQFATALVSIHHDSVGKESKRVSKKSKKVTPTPVNASGFSIFISKLNAQYNDSLRLAKCIGAELIDAGFLVGLYHKNSTKRQRLLVGKCFGIYRAYKFVVLKNTTIPAVLVECGVISNPKEEEMLNQNRDRMASAIALGIARYVGYIEVQR